MLFFIPLQLVNATKVNPQQSADSSMPVAILKYVNEYRLKHGLRALQMNNLASEEARKHSSEMARHSVPFGHKDFDKRIKRLYREIKECQAGAENVAYNYKTAKIVVEQWLTSPGHRKNIMGNYNMTGVGIARDKAGKLYYTQIFLRNKKQHKNILQRG